MTKQLRLWATCCSHVGTDLKFGRESLADAIRQSENGSEEGGPAFEWDIAVVLGDHSGGQTTPTDEEGREIVRQFGVSGRHRREDFYTVIGNHDAAWVPDRGLERLCGGGRGSIARAWWRFRSTLRRPCPPGPGSARPRRVLFRPT